jgi:ELWxxDGT repeat protein
MRPYALGVAFVLVGLELAAQNPRLLLDINPGSRNSGVRDFASFGTTTVFVANDGQFGFEPWRTDGSTANTRMIRDTYPGGSSTAWEGAVVVDRYVFQNLGGLWVTDGTAAGTFELRRLAIASRAAPIGLGGRALFVADDGTTGNELWRSDGTTAGTVVVADLAPGVTSSRPSMPVTVGERTFFLTTQSSTELWWTDGTAAGTARVPGFPTFLVPNLEMAAAQQRLFCTDFSAPRRLWVVDATGARTVTTFQGLSPSRLVGFGNDIVFLQNDSQFGQEPWISDGTAAGTRLIADIRPGPAGSNPYRLRSMGLRVLFLADDGVSGIDPWISDGTPAGTQRLVDWPAGVLAGEIEVISDDFAVIQTGNASGGSDLWFTDGTPMGTRLELTDARFLHAHLGSIFVERPSATIGWEPYVLDPGALAHEVGHGCGDVLRVPSLHSTRPRLGASVTLRGAAAPTPGVGALALGMIADPPLRLGPSQGTCVAYIELSSASIVSLFPTNTPTWTWTLPLPNVSALEGISIGAQAFFGPSANTAGFEVSNGVYLTLGN